MAAKQLSGSPARPSTRCCRCTGLAKCLQCACVRSGIACSRCFPGDSGNCHNRPSSAAASPSQPPSSQTSRGSSSRPPTRCCRCNGSAKCLRCACVRSGIACSCCLPGDSGNCHNGLPSGAAPPSSSSPPFSPEPESTAPTLPSISSIMNNRTPTLHHVPKGARDQWAEVLGLSFSSVVRDPSDVSCWSRLFMLPKCVLARPAASHRLRWRDIRDLVKSRLRRWSEGEFESLWEESTVKPKTNTRRGRPDQKQHNITRSKRAIQDGQYSKALKALASEGLASPNEDVYKEMLSKHPQASQPALPEGPPPQPPKLSESAILKGARSFPTGSAPGPSGLRPSHLREAVNCPSPDRANRVLFTLTSFVNLLAAGLTPISIRPHLCGATLLASKKKSGGLRPIAVGEVLRRLTSKCLAASARSEVLNRLLPHQLGVGVKGGCETIIHSVSNLLSSNPPGRCWVLLVDFSNAFNSFDREAMFREFRQHAPSLSPWIESCYSGQPNLLLGEHSIRSCCGVQQGDPLGPLGFALVLQPVIERIKEKVAGLSLNAWYLDDGTIVGTPEQLQAALLIIEEEGKRVGLHLNRSKSLLYVPDTEDATTSPLPPEIPIARHGFTLLGCPIGPVDFCEASFHHRVSKIQTTLGLLRDLEDSQLETTLLRSCLSFPKVAFVLRACPPSHIQASALEFDAVMRRALEGILGGPISVWSWLKASLPCSKGGLGLRSAALHAPAAFLDSTLRSRSLAECLAGCSMPLSAHVEDALTSMAQAAGRPDWVSLDQLDCPLRQRALSAAIDTANHHQLIETAPTTRFRALALSTSLPHAFDWLNVVPSPSLGLSLQDREFRCCISYWLGVPLHNDPYGCPECHSPADIFGDHQVGCGGNGDRVARHNAIRDVVFLAAQSAALAPSKETPNLLAGSAERPADVLLPNWCQGKSAALDIHVISPLQSATVAEAAYNQGHALDVGVRRKLTSNLSTCRSAGVECIPMVAETLGGLASDCISTIREIGSAIQARSGSLEATNQLFGRFSIALWRGNAVMWLHRQPTFLPELDGLT